MEKSTCKLLLSIGIFWLVIAFFLTVGGIEPRLYSSINEIYFSIIFRLILFGLPGWILLIIAITKWHSEEEHKEVRQAQLQAIKKGKVNVELKGKMRKLK